MSISQIISNQKLRGGYYTPKELASAISCWAITSKGSQVLEPSLGDGAFIKAIIEQKKALGETNSNIQKTVSGVEINEKEFKKFSLTIKENYDLSFKNVMCMDFFLWYPQNKKVFDVIVGNPPFIRYQNFPEPSRSYAIKKAKEIGVNLNKLTNIWVPFLVLSVGILNENGRLGMVVPAELLQVSYAGPLRKFLSDSFKSITIFTCNELLFDNAEQEVVILIAEGKKSCSSDDGSINLISTESKAELLSSIKNFKQVKHNKIIDHTVDKWTKYFLNETEINFIKNLEKDSRISRFSDFYEVDVGIVTGANKYFIVNKSIAENYKLNNYIKPAIGRSNQLKDEILTLKDWESLWEEGESVGLLDFSEVTNKVPAIVKRYLEIGLAQGINNGYKCSIRKDWYKIPSLWVSDAFMFRQIHDFPHLVLNEAKAISTDTIHRVKAIPGKQFKQVLFYTYLTAASAEIEGRSYGGGVLELEPSEAEKLLIPNPYLIDEEKLNYLVQRRQNGQFLRKNSHYVLTELLGYSTDEVRILENIYLKLFNRRKTRKIR